MPSQTAQERGVVAAAVLASAMAFLDATALNVALPAIQKDMQLSGSTFLWLVNGYLLTLGALILACGALGDKLGHARVLAAGIVTFMVGSCACGLAPNAAVLLSARVLQGVGGALLIPAGPALLAAVFGAEREGQAIGTWSAATTLVTVAGPAVGGGLAQLGLWRVIFLLNAPLAIAALVILKRAAPSPKRREGRIDVAGALLGAIALFCVTCVAMTAPERGLDGLMIALALGGAAALVAFALVELRGRAPMLPPRLFRIPAFVGANLLTLFLYGALSALMFFLSLNLVQIQGYPPVQAGLAFLPLSLLLMALSRRMGRHADAHGPRRLLILGPALVSAAMALLALPGVDAGSYWLTYFPGLCLFGLGMALTVAPLTTTAIKSVPAEQSGVASGVNNATARVAGVLATAALGGLGLYLFRRSVEANAPPGWREALVREAHKLGAAKLPEGAPPLIFKQAFVSMFRVVALCCAGLAALASVSAAVFVRGGEPRKQGQV